MKFKNLGTLYEPHGWGWLNIMKVAVQTGFELLDTRTVYTSDRI